MSDDKITLDHYKKIATAYGPSSRSTMRDPYIRDAEVSFFLAEISQYLKENQILKPRLLDLGCGNGSTLKAISEQFPQFELFGIDLTPELCDHARELLDGIASIFCADLRSTDLDLGAFDIIITERCLINIKKHSHRKTVFDYIFKGLKKRGRLLSAESFSTGLMNLNRALAEVKLPPVEVPPYNRYINDKEWDQLAGRGFKELETGLSRHHLSTHFYLTRVLHPLIRPEGSKKEGTEFLKFFTQGLATGIGEYSPLQFRALEKL